MLPIALHREAAPRHLRCATILLQLCSAILKGERGASHPERARHPPEPPTDKSHASGSADEAPAADNNKPVGCDSLAAQACAKIANAHLDAMVRGATALMADDLNLAKAGVDADGVESSVAGAGSGVDVAFWVLSLVSDVLKHCRKRKWHNFVYSAGVPVGCKRGREGHAREGSGGVASGAVVVENCGDIDTNVNANANITTNANTNTSANTINSTNIYTNSDAIINANINTNNTNTITNTNTNSGGARGGAVLGQLDLVGLTRVVAAVPVRLGTGTVDTALKWLEVMQASPRR